MTHRYIGTVHVPNRQGNTSAHNEVKQIAGRDQTVCALLILFVIGLGHPADCRANDLADSILDVFPESPAPTFYDKQSNLELQRSFQPWTRNSKWHPDLDEKSVFHARLQHKSVNERCWEIGIGKGACRAGGDKPFHYRDEDCSQWGNMADKTFATVGHTGKSIFGHFVVDGDVCLPVAEGVDFADRRYDDKAAVTMPVGSYKSNAFGLYDMHGNVAEWTLTDFGNGEKTVKGGSFLDRPSRCRAEARLGYPPWQNVHNTGFRIVVND